MTLLEWRKNGERRSMAMDALNNPAIREMLAVMETEHPAKKHHSIMDGFGATRALGRIEGFQEALDMLHAFAEGLPEPVEALEATFGVMPESEPKR